MSKGDLVLELGLAVVVVLLALTLVLLMLLLPPGQDREDDPPARGRPTKPPDGSPPITADGQNGR